jgi:hypothetical protein
MKKQKEDKVFEILRFIDQYFKENNSRGREIYNEYRKDLPSSPTLVLIAKNFHKLFTKRILDIGYSPIELTNDEFEKYFPGFLSKGNKRSEVFPDFLKGKFSLTLDQVEKILITSFFWANDASMQGFVERKQLKKRIPKGQPPTTADNKYKKVAYILKAIDKRIHKGSEALACEFTNIKPSALSKWKGGTDSEGKKNFDKFLKWKNETPIEMVDQLGPLITEYIDNRKTSTLKNIQKIISQ